MLKLKLFLCSVLVSHAYCIFFCSTLYLNTVYFYRCLNCPTNGIQMCQATLAISAPPKNTSPIMNLYKEHVLPFFRLFQSTLLLHRGPSTPLKSSATSALLPSKTTPSYQCMLLCTIRGSCGFVNIATNHTLSTRQTS